MIYLCAIESTQGVTWEVAKTRGPVNVLQHTLRIRCRLDPHVLAILRVPQSRQCFDGHITIDKRLLQLIAHDNMQVVGHLISLDANQARTHLVERAGERGSIYSGEMPWESFTNGSTLTPPFHSQTPHPILPQPRSDLLHSSP